MSHVQVFSITTALVASGGIATLTFFDIPELQSQPAYRSLSAVRWLFSRGSHVFPSASIISTIGFIYSASVDNGSFSSLYSLSNNTSKANGFLLAAALSFGIEPFTQLMIPTNFALIRENNKLGGARSKKAAAEGDASADRTALDSVKGSGEGFEFTDLSGPQERTTVDSNEEEDEKVYKLLEKFRWLNLWCLVTIYKENPATKCQDDINVKRTAYWCHSGPLLDVSKALPPTFYEFETQVLTGSIHNILIPFLAHINNLLVAKGVRHYFFTIRASVPTHEFDRPRWHTDELFFTEAPNGVLLGTRLGLKSISDKYAHNDGTNWKICTTLLGPSTLFIPPNHQSEARKRQDSASKNASTEHECLSIRCVGCAAAADAVREELATTLGPFGAEAASLGECAMFKIGRDFGAVHSEPCMSEGSSGRIFVNVVPGTEKELGQLMGKWGMKFPRQWWVGGW
ncbi:hypothetical protein FPSE_05331 [Fusarium pseudograminearum CS3096]|uniref:Uncharacterized protein n=1 Tax=Fusarium pseudograminearum (strain CS3096) TaxID=1028729 RepID=K3UQ93_FUSPC|nr:hypothetical protein FPSE_05331 [Fusarium pseudograminearum CS3096]EKJ74581.1 hypothetical protein FPSE_05331 [Fusarium pseudograminearum CS3096]